MKLVKKLVNRTTMFCAILVILSVPALQAQMTEGATASMFNYNGAWNLGTEQTQSFPLVYFGEQGVEHGVDAPSSHALQSIDVGAQQQQQQQLQPEPASGSIQGQRSRAAQSVLDLLFGGGEVAGGDEGAGQIPGGVASTSAGDAPPPAPTSGAAAGVAPQSV